MAASPHALGVGTPSITKWMLPSSSANANAGAGCSATTCAAACGPAAPLPRLRLAASSTSTSCCSAQAPRHQAKLRLQATAVDGEVSVAEEQASPSASPFVLEEGLEQQPQQRRRGNAGRRVSVKSEDLKEGALFPGTVRTVTTYGAFVDIGAFTDGLVHISQLSDSYVSQVQDLVAVGQQVSVRILDVDFNAGRISLSMRPVPAPVSADAESEGNAAEGDAAAAPRGPPSERRKIAGRGNSANKSSSSSSKPSVQKGQTLTGVVKNVIKSGAFVTLPGGDEGFLRATDMSNPGTVLESLVGQELSVRVQRIDGRGKVSLTQKVEVDMKQINLSINNNELGGAANPFELAFRKSNFVVQEDGKAGEAVAAEDSEDEVASQEEIAVAEALAVEAVAAEDSEDEVPAQEEIAVPEALAGEAVAAEVDEVTSEEEIAVPEALAGESVAPEDSEDEVASQEEIAVPEALVGAAVAAEDSEDEVASQEEIAVPEASAGEAVAAEDSADEVASQAEIAVPEASAGEAVAAEDSEDKVAFQEEIAVPQASAGEAVAAEDSADEVASQEEIAVAEASAGEAVAAEDTEDEVPSQEEIAVPEASAGEAVAAEEREDEVPSQEEIAVPEASSGEAVAAEESEDEVASEEETAVPETSAGEAVAAEDSEDEVASQEEIAVAEALEVEETLRPVEDAVVEVSSVAEDTSSSAGDTGVESASVPEVEETVAEETTVAVEEQEVQVPAPVVEASVSRPEPVQEPEAKKDVASAGAGAAAVVASALVVAPALVKELRQISGAGMMDCKKALVACNNNLEQAVEYLRKKGLASADKKASRVAAEGAIGSYIHDGRIGVLIEVNSETDFVARGEKFKELVQDLAMQVAAYPQVQYVSVEDIPEEIAERERQIESTKEDLASKPEAVRSKIVEGRVSKLLKEVALLEQPYIRNDKVLVREHIKETIAVLGENLQVRRFHRFNLGEGIQKKVANLAAEVAEQTKPKEVKEVKDVPPPAAKAAAEPAESAPEVVVPAAAVKVLRQATGAGMMDCKKALAACGGDVEKATEYLRKKGLASAEKKASRVAAEGAIGKYIHDGRIGVLLEVNCETDFVARGDRFKELVQDLAMQVVACPQVQYVSLEDIPAEYVAREKEVESQKEDLASKPEAVRSKIVDGRVSKRLVELALLEQAYIRNDKVLVKDHVKETIAALGENIQVRRFVKFVLGEGIQKKTVDFAAEVAAQTRPK